VLTSVDLDHVIGLLLLREFQPLRIYCTHGVRKALVANDVFRVLNRIPEQSRWIEITPGETFNLSSPTEQDLKCTPVALPGAFPQHVHGRERLSSADAVIGLILESANGVRVGYFPVLPKVNQELRKLLDGSNAVFVDGTFWTDDELRRFVPNAASARDIGHIPVSGVGGSLETLAGLRAAHKIYTHINNTNPMLDEDSSEHAAVLAAGWQLGFDGWQQIFQHQFALSQ
jgi:pyrroloquinoline quinone biosynthesis protein B